MQDTFETQFLFGLSIIVFITTIIISCSAFDKSTSEERKLFIGNQYPNQLGDIPYRSDIDDPNFLLCDADNVIHSRLSLTYEGGWDGIDSECQKQFEYLPKFSSFSGYVMIRFLINCNYETDRFRMETMALDFSPLVFPDHLSNQLLAIVQGLDGWKRTSRYNDPVDCSKFVNFKIIDGKIDSIIH